TLRADRRDRRHPRLSQLERAPWPARPQPRDGLRRPPLRLRSANHRAAPRGLLRRQGRPSDHQGDDMSQAAAVHGAHGAVEPAESPLTPESWGKLGMWIFLAGDAVGFGTLLAGYGAMRATSADWPSPYEVLGINLTALMTFLLICSSVTMVKALEWLGKGDKIRAQKFLFYNALGRTYFLSLQVFELTHLIHRTLHNISQPIGALLIRH